MNIVIEILENTPKSINHGLYTPLFFSSLDDSKKITKQNDFIVSNEKIEKFINRVYKSKNNDISNILNLVSSYSHEKDLELK